MKQSVEYATGAREGTIHDFLLRIDRPTADMRYALVTCLDSCSEPARLIDASDHLRPLRRELAIIGNGLLIPTRLLLAAERENRIFFGFDEIWFVSRRNIEPKPEALFLVGPHRVNDTSLVPYYSWLKACSCSLALGDGTGLNYWLKVRGAARLFLESLTDSVHAQAG